MEHVGTAIRIKGKIGRVGSADCPCEDCQKVIGKWFFTIYTSDHDGSNTAEVGTFGPFDSESEASRTLKEMVSVGVEALRQAPGVTGVDFTDLKAPAPKNATLH